MDPDDQVNMQSGGDEMYARQLQNTIGNRKSSAEDNYNMN